MKFTERLAPALACLSGLTFKSPAAISPGLSLLAIWFVLAGSAGAQTDLTRVYGTEDADVPTPSSSVVLGEQDAGALQELIDYLTAVTVGQWQGLKGTGTYTFPSVDAGNPDQATLTISQGNKFRLDVQTSTGTQSTRMAGSYGETSDPTGIRRLLPRATANLGLLFFPQLLVSTFPTPATTLIDRGQVQIQGRTLHHITVAEPLVDSQQTTSDPSQISIVDLYFDSSTHLLIKTAARVQIDPADRTRYVQVVTFDDYRNLQNTTVAYHFHQSLNGQPQWTLQLSNVVLGPDTNNSDFYF